MKIQRILMQTVVLAHAANSVRNQRWSKKANFLCITQNDEGNRMVQELTAGYKQHEHTTHPTPCELHSELPEK